MSKVVGILGGMGPMSTVDLMRMVTERTPVRSEREHLRVLVDSRPQIPDRPAALLGTGESPVPMMQESARMLEEKRALSFRAGLKRRRQAHGLVLRHLVVMIGRSQALNFAM